MMHEPNKAFQIMGGICPGGICLGGMCPRAYICPGGKCPGGYMSGGVLSCHRVGHIPLKQNNYDMLI